MLISDKIAEILHDPALVEAVAKEIAKVITRVDDEGICTRVVKDWPPLLKFHGGFICIPESGSPFFEPKPVWQWFLPAAQAAMAAVYCHASTNQEAL